MLLGALGGLVVLAAWEVGSRAGLIDESLLSCPTEIAVALRDFYLDGNGWQHTSTSATEFGLGFSLAAVVGLVVGVAIGWWRWLDELTDPVFSFAYASPRIALVPLLVVWFGIGLGSKVAVVFLSAVFPILMNTRTGVRTVDPALLRLSRSLHASQWQIFRTIVIPSAVPSIVTGMRLAVGVGLVGVVVGEMIASSEGLGYTILYAGNTFQMPLMFAALFVVSATGVVASAVLGTLERRLDRWRPGRSD